ncbi:MAG: glycoside hydrolase family 30 protein [Candidatus Izemoplasmatales bacterium]|nr:glycoside hydrolase family 30 protein [Candidatus Izemoplasmatales bacterium]
MQNKIYVTSKYEKYRHQIVPVESNDQPDLEIFIDKSAEFQQIIGFGGAFTEAACYTLSRLSKKNQDILLNAYYDKENGLGYNLGRIHMNSSDFALGNYTYVKDNDKNLQSFDISREFDFVIPTIRKAENIAKDKIDLLISPWSPPAWMKTNNEMNNGGKLKPEYFQSWANYYVKFLDEIKKAGLNSFAITVQNEPAAKQTWDSCLYTKEQERDFVKYYLGPTIKQSKFSDTKIFIWDHNRDIVVERASAVLEDKEAAKYVAGTAIHWYVSEEFSNVGKVHDLFPDKQIIFSEGCIEGGPHPNIYETGERYSRNIIGDFSNWCEAFIDWNLTLDEIGGPNHVGNYCDAPILSDTINDKLIFNSSYYHLAHFSKHIKPGAYRIKSIPSSNLIKQIAFKNPDDSIVLVILNDSEKDITIVIKINNEAFRVKSVKRSIMTIVSKGEL